MIETLFVLKAAAGQLQALLSPLFISETALVAIITAVLGFLGGLVGSIPVAIKLREEARISAKQSDLTALQTTINELQEENRRLRERMLEVENENMRLRSRIQDMEDESEAKDARISALDAAIAKKNGEVSALKRQLDEASVARDDRMQKIRELEAELHSLRQIVAKLEERDTGELKPPAARSEV